uniref:Uncharacterized protein n=1 Tax=Solanum lycopersicum TaxID=4081 RepID=A0A3Q7FI98_SOLLC
MGGFCDFFFWGFHFDRDCDMVMIWTLRDLRTMEQPLWEEISSNLLSIGIEVLDSVNLSGLLWVKSMRYCQMSLCVGFPSHYMNSEINDIL